MSSALTCSREKNDEIYLISSAFTVAIRSTIPAFAESPSAGSFGFAPQPGLVLPGVPAEYFQALVFKGNVPQSAVRYHAAFEATGAAA